eukprot:m.40522 g.40522  ORF g.40522 m.40522 type:complete len:233 (+) comp10444_c0_seq1:441-1139(+)
MTKATLAIFALVIIAIFGCSLVAADNYPSTEVDHVEAVMACRPMELTTYQENSVCGHGKCADSDGAFTIWSTDDLTVLPEERRSGFHNSEWTAAGKASSFVKDNFVSAKGSLHKNLHCHWTPDGGTSLYIRLCQHQTQRQYLRGLEYQEVCNGAQLGKDSSFTSGQEPLVSRCDCTKTCPTNNECAMQECLAMAEMHVKCNNCGKECNLCHRRGDRRGWGWEQKISCIESYL